MRLDHLKHALEIILLLLVLVVRDQQHRVHRERETIHLCQPMADLALVVRAHLEQVRQSVQDNQVLDLVLGNALVQFLAVGHFLREMVVAPVEVADQVVMPELPGLAVPVVGMAVGQDEVEVADQADRADRAVRADQEALVVAVDLDKLAELSVVAVKVAVKQIANRSLERHVAKRSITYAHQHLAAQLFHVVMVLP